MKKNYTREHFKNREEWLNSRGIGGSSAAAIVDLNPWQTKLELFNSFFEPRKVDSDNESKAHGRVMEPLIRKAYSEYFPQYKMIVPKGYEMFRRVDEPLMTATVDGRLVEIDTKRKGIWECKTHDIKNANDAVEWRGGIIPKNYLIQVLHYLLVLNDAEFVEITANLRFLTYGEETKTHHTETYFYHIDRNEVQGQLAWLESEELKFIGNLKSRIPPNGRIIVKE